MIPTPEDKCVHTFIDVDGTEHQKTIEGSPQFWQFRCPVEGTSRGVVRTYVREIYKYRQSARTRTVYREVPSG